MSNELAACLNCRELNSKVSEECLFCGARLPWAVTLANAGYNTASQAPQPLLSQSVRQQDQHEMWISLVSFLFPPAGLAMLLFYLTNSPMRAKSAFYGLVPLISFILIVIFAHVAAALALMAAGGHG
jgi:hypothetical protein